jgi:NAD(P)H dehydrogenase (quinone)
MTTLPRILVTGAAGKTGLATAQALLARSDVQTRVLVRRDDNRARDLRDAGAEVVIGDMSDIRDMHRAMHDVQRAYFLAPATHNSLDHALNFAVAAEDAKLEHVVALGQWLSSPSHPAVMTRRTWLIDRLMAWIPNVDHTVINVGWFADNYMPMLGLAAQLGVFPLASGTELSPPISNEDIGRVVAGVLADPAPYVGRTLRPTGPEMLSPQQIADVFATVLGRSVRHIDAEASMLSKSLKASGFDPFTQVQVESYMTDYGKGAFGLGGPTDVVQRVTGAPAEDFTSIVRRYAAADPMARRSVANTLRALVNMVRVLATSPMDVERWQKSHGLPWIADPELCVNDSNWHSSHAAPHAFSVQSRLGTS